MTRRSWWLAAAVLLPVWLVHVAVAAEGVSVADPGAVPIALRSNIVAEVLILIGCVFLLAAAIGMLRFPDVYIRLHASTKLVTLGGLGIFGGAALAFAPAGLTPRVMVIALFFFLTAPLSGYMIGRSAYLRGLVPYRESTSVDEWQANGVERGVNGAEDVQEGA